MIEYVIYFIDGTADAFGTFTPYIFVLSNANAIVNFFLYTSRHKDIRMVVKCLFICKEVTPAMLKANY